MIEYAAVLGGCVLVTLPLDLVWGLHVYARWRLLLRVAAAVVPAWVALDAVAAHQGLWRYNPRYVLPPRVLGLPLEEVAFFVVIPFVSVLTYEAVRVVRRAPAGRSRERGRTG